MTMAQKLKTAAGCCLALALGLAIFLAALAAHGQPASAPAVAVTAVTKVAAKAPASTPLARAALLAPAKAAPASQPAQAAAPPASQPAIRVPAGFWPWLQANAAWLIPLVLFVLSTLATVLSKYPKAKGVVAALRMVMGGLSALEFKDGKRAGLVLKWPVMPPAPPPDETPKA